MVRKGGKVVMAGDGQASMGDTVMKSNSRKVRRIGKDGKVIAGFAGSTADAFTLLERLEAKLEQYPDQLMRACVELAKDWRTDRYLRRLEAMMLVADKDVSLAITGIGDVFEPEHGVMAIGSGGNYALAAARALLDTETDAEEIATQSHEHRCRHLRLHQPQHHRRSDGRRMSETFAVPAELLERAQALIERGAEEGFRPLIGIAGPPASGKSTLAHALAEQTGGIAVPMDGFHLDNPILEARGLRQRKGAPETFRCGGLSGARPAAQNRRRGVRPPVRPGA